jgi:hypothetical protein
MCCLPGSLGQAGRVYRASYSKLSTGPATPAGGRTCAQPSSGGKPGRGGSSAVTGQPSSLA